MSDPLQPIDRARFEDLVRRHHAAVWRSAARVAPDSDSASDVTQQVYVALLEGRIALTGTDDERVLRWFAVRLALQDRRGSKARREREERYSMAHEERVEVCEPESSEAVAHLARCVAELPRDLRLALRLRFEEGLTYAALGEALAISEPGALGRVRRALDELKARLTRAGLAAFTVDLERRLATGAQAPSAVPASLARELVGLHGRALAAPAASFAAPLALAAALAGAALGVLWWTSGDPDVASRPPVETVTRAAAWVARDAEPAPAASADDTSNSARAPVAPESGGLAADASLGVPWSAARGEPSGTIVGVLVDLDGRPIPDLIVGAESLERQGKMARYGALARTSADGSFALVVPVEAGGARNFRVSLQNREPIQGDQAEKVGVGADRRVDLGRLTVNHVVVDAPGEYTLDVLLADPAGAPVADALVRLSRRVRSPDGFSPVTFEAGGKSDASGRVRLAGHHVGPKLLHVDARASGFRLVRREWHVGLGVGAETIVLQRALEITGNLRDADGRAVVPREVVEGFGHDVQLHASTLEDPNDWITAEIGAGGEFALRGLDDASYELRLMSSRWSPVCLSVAAGTRGLLVVLKREDDPRDVGQHCAEIHARLVPSGSGPAPGVTWEDLETIALPAGLGPAEFEADWRANCLYERPVQKSWDGGPMPEPSDRFHVTGLAAGTYVVVARARGAVPAFAGPVTLAAHEIARDVEARIEPGVEVRGRVVDADGRPPRAAFLLITGTGPHSDEVVAAAQREIDETGGHPATWRQSLTPVPADGRFAIGQLPPDLSFRLVVLREKGPRAESGRCVARAAGEIALTLPRTR